MFFFFSHDFLFVGSGSPAETPVSTSEVGESKEGRELEEEIAQKKQEKEKKKWK